MLVLLLTVEIKASARDRQPIRVGRSHREPLAAGAGRGRAAGGPGGPRRPALAPALAARRDRVPGGVLRRVVPHARPAKGRGGPRDWTPEQTALAEALALEWLERVAERAPAESADAEQARLALDIAQAPARAGAMGLGNLVREAVKTLARVSWLANMGMYVAERLFLTSLAQVTRYLTDDATRAQAREAVLSLVTPDTRAIVGHSLGSVVAYECAHRLGAPAAVARDARLAARPAHARGRPPRPPAVVPAVGVRLAERRQPRGRRRRRAPPPPLFARDIPAPARFEGVWFAEPGKAPHRAETYLGRIAIGRAVIQALA